MSSSDSSSSSGSAGAACVSPLASVATGAKEANADGSAKNALIYINNKSQKMYLLHEQICNWIQSHSAGSYWLVC